MRYFLLPDYVTLPLVAAGLVHPHMLLDPDAIGGYIIGAAAGYAFVRLLRFAYRRWRQREGMGLGDAKLLAAAGAWVSWQGLPQCSGCRVPFGSEPGVGAVMVDA